MIGKKTPLVVQPDKHNDSGWAVRKAHNKTSDKQTDTKAEALDYARKLMKVDGYPAMIVLDSNWSEQRVTLNSQTLKNPGWWEDQGMYTVQG